MEVVANKISAGSTDVEIGNLEDNDEIGDINRAFSRLIDYFKTKALIANQIAAGDLTVTHQAASTDDTLGNSFNAMLERLRNLISKVGENTKTVNNAAHYLHKISSMTGRAADQIGSTTQQVAIGRQHQAESVTSTAFQIDQLSRSIDSVAHGTQTQAQEIVSATELASDIAKSVDSVASFAEESVGTAERTALIAKTGSETVEGNLQAMDSIKHQVDLSVEKVMLMGERSEEIGTILVTINDIASQTNMLALNAAIEAARAGEHGKGFAVVADEVRRLAEHSAQSANEISALIEEVQETVQEAVTAMNRSSTEVDSGVTSANEAGQALDEILSSAEATSQQVRGIYDASRIMEGHADKMISSMENINAVVEENAAAAEEMTASAAEANKAIEDISSVSEENSAAVEEVSASTQEMNAQVQEIAESAEELSSLAQRLAVIISQFKVDEQENLAEFVELFKEAHEAWVGRLDKIMAGSITMDENKMVDHKHCLLGEWYYGRNSSECQDFQAYKDLENPHIELHKNAKACVAAYNKGDKSTAQKKADKVAENASVITSLLDQFKIQCQRK